MKLLSKDDQAKLEPSDFNYLGVTITEEDDKNCTIALTGDMFE